MNRRHSALLLVLGACTPRVGTDAREAPVGGEVVARVDGSPIHAREVAQRAAARGMTARAALTSLEDERMLREAALRRGLRPADLELRREQVLAQMVLRSLEREHGEATLDEARVAERMPALAVSMRRPERRVVEHLLVRAETGDARELARAETVAGHALSLARSEPLGEATLERVEGRLREEDSANEIVVERLGALEAGAPIEEPFLRAVFDASGPGLLPRTVRTRFGVHVVQILRIEPAYEPAESEVRARATEAVLEADRSAALASLLESARDRFGVEVHLATARRLLGDDSLFREAR